MQGGCSLKTILPTPTAQTPIRRSICICVWVLPSPATHAGSLSVCLCLFVLFCCSLSVEDLMHLACSSVFCGGGTNQELALHCLYECNGDIMVSARNRLGPVTRQLLCVMDGWMGEGESLQTRPAPFRYCEICVNTLDCDVSHCTFFSLRKRKVGFPSRGNGCCFCCSCCFLLVSIRCDGITPTQLKSTSRVSNGQDLTACFTWKDFPVSHSDRAKQKPRPSTQLQREGFGCHCSSVVVVQTCQGSVRIVCWVIFEKNCNYNFLITIFKKLKETLKEI